MKPDDDQQNERKLQLLFSCLDEFELLLIFFAFNYSYLFYIKMTFWCRWMSCIRSYNEYKSLISTGNVGDRPPSLFKILFLAHNFAIKAKNKSVM